MKNRLLLATALTALSFSAFAADLPARTFAPVAPAPIFSWTGFYVGGTVGAIGATTRYSGSDYSYGFSKNDAQSYGAVAGVTAGYNYQIGSMVLGLEADYSFSSAKNSFGSSDYVTGQTKIDSLGTVRARFGYAIDRTLLFATGGLAFGKVQSKTFLYHDSADCRSGFNKTQFGWTVGAGVEHALTQNLTIKAEALYVDLGSKKNVSNNCGCSTSFKNTATVARVGVNFKF
jgi:outer membrane immunogenic protein